LNAHLLTQQVIYTDIAYLQT